jgi:branched-chain amino acid transport system permease protein
MRAWFANSGIVGWWWWPIIIGAILSIAGNFFSTYVLYVATSWIAFGLVALGLDLVWGKGGDLSLGHTTFFGLGGYLYGVVAINYQSFFGNTFLIAILTGALIGCLVSSALAYFLFYGRLGPLQTTIITYTFTLVLYTASVGFTAHIGAAYVGGDNGMTGIPPLSIGFGANATPLSQYGVYLAALVIAIVLFIGIVALLRTPFGLIIEGVRQNILKIELLGYDIRMYRLTLFAVSGAIAGIGGAIFASWAAYINPTAFGVTEALLIPIYVLVGGRGTLFGAFIGTVFVGGLSFWLGGGVVGGQTTLIMGIGLILLVLVAPAGLIGIGRKVVNVKSSLTRGIPAQIKSKIHQGELTKDSTLFTSKAKHDFKHGPVLLETRNLVKRFGGVRAVDNVSLTFQDQGINCLIGPNGAGKSTFLNICLGLLKPDAGAILFKGADITRWDPYRRVKSGLGIKLQVARIFDEMTAWQNLWLAAFSRLKDKKAANVRTERILQLIGLDNRIDVKGQELSHGEQQWLDIGMVLSLEPRVIFLDEPAGGMTSQERHQTIRLLHRIAEHAGIVVVEHDMDFVRLLQAPVTVLHQGSVFAKGSIDELRKDDRVLDIYLGRLHFA